MYPYFYQIFQCDVFDVTENFGLSQENGEVL